MSYFDQYEFGKPKEMFTSLPKCEPPPVYKYEPPPSFSCDPYGITSNIGGLNRDPVRINPISPLYQGQQILNQMNPVPPVQFIPPCGGPFF
jgi:hypothetical protein